MIKAAERIQKLAFKAEWTMMSKSARDVGGLTTVYREQTSLGPSRIDTIHRFSGKAYVEPKYGYLISAGGCIIEDSLTPNIDHPNPPWREAMPDPRAFKAAASGKTPVTHYPTLISLRHFWEWNYYHFYCDVLGRLKLIDSLLDKSVPLLLGNYVDDVPFAKQIIALGSLADRRWILPGHNFVSADETYFCRVRRPWKDRLEYIVGQMNLPKPEVSSDDRIYLVRPPSGTRRVINQEDIDPILKKYGFRTVDTSTMTISEQIDLFAQARFLVAIHGAGIVNTIYRDGAPLGLIELRSDVYGSEDFVRLCREYGYYYKLLVGKSAGGEDQHASFRICPEELEQSIADMCG